MALMSCPKCGEKISETARVCIFCGKVLREPTEREIEAEENRKVLAAAKKVVEQANKEKVKEKKSLLEEVIGEQASTVKSEEIDDRQVESDREIIKNNERWFKFYTKLPLILAIVFGVLTLLPHIGLLVYVLAKLALSYPILHLYYLKKIEKNTRK